MTDNIMMRLYELDGPRPIKRRTADELYELLMEVLAILPPEGQGVITLRHLFYRLVSVGIIEKTESAYKLLGRHVAQWRREGYVRWNAFADSTRWHIQPPTFDGIEDALERTRETYRRDLWETQPHYVELWIEKDAIASIVTGVANGFGVPVFVARGFASLTSLHSAAQTFNRASEAGKRVTIFHLGDYDPSGHAAGDAIEWSLREDFDCEVEFQRLAVTPEQIKRLKLPTRPTKRSTHATDWDGGSVELDAMLPTDLQQIVEDNITGLIDRRAWKALQKIEAAERESLAKIRIA